MRNLSLIALTLLLTFASCTPRADKDTRPADSSTGSHDEQWIDATIRGSAESPDPVLVRAQALAASGQLEILGVMESYPLQIRVRAPQSLIDELENMPRK